MNSFWLFTALMCLSAIAIILAPLIRKPSAQEDDELTSEAQARQEQNVSIFKERLAELQTDQQEGRITQAQFAELKAELEQSLLADVDENASQVKGSGSKGTRIWLGATIAVVLGLSYPLYFEWGAYDKQMAYQSSRFSPDEIAAAQQAARQGDMNALITQLHEKLKQSPENVEGWLMLARSAMNVDNYTLAVEAYNAVIERLADSDEPLASVYGLLAQAHYFQAGAMSVTAKQALDKALELDDQEINAIGLLAIDAFERAAYAEAVSLWEKILKIDPEHPAKSSINAGIARAKSLGGLDKQVVEESSAPDAVGPRVQVAVTLDASLAYEPKSQDVLFVFARAVQGPPIPLAAVRLAQFDFPLEVSLSDEQAMNPALKLSSAEEVMITARISRFGQPMAQTGDLEGQLDSVSLGPEVKVSLSINRRVE